MIVTDDCDGDVQDGLNEWVVHDALDDCEVMNLMASVQAWRLFLAPQKVPQLYDYINSDYGSDN
jgi:hypothetical protein